MSQSCSCPACRCQILRLQRADLLAHDLDDGQRRPDSPLHRENSMKPIARWAPRPSPNSVLRYRDPGVLLNCQDWWVESLHEEKGNTFISVRTRKHVRSGDNSKCLIQTATEIASLQQHAQLTFASSWLMIRIFSRLAFLSGTARTATAVYRERKPKVAPKRLDPKKTCECPVGWLIAEINKKWKIWRCLMCLDANLRLGPGTNKARNGPTSPLLSSCCSAAFFSCEGPSHFCGASGGTSDNQACHDTVAKIWEK